MHIKKLLCNYYFLQYCCANLWVGNLNGDFTEFTVTLYKSHVSFSRNVGAAGIGECGVRCLHWFFPFCYCSMYACRWPLCTPRCIECGGLPQTIIHWSPLGLNYLFTHLLLYCHLMQICPFWLHLAEECWEAQESLPLPLSPLPIHAKEPVRLQEAESGAN